VNVGWLEVVPEQPATYYIGKRGPFTSPQRIPVILGLATVLQCGTSKGTIIPEFGYAAPRRQKVNGKWFKWSVPWDRSPAVGTPARPARKKAGAKPAKSNA